MADDKLNTGPGEKKIPEAPESVTAGQPQAPAPEQAGPAKPDPGDVVVSFEQINELMGEKRKAARAEVEKAGDAPAKEQAPGEAEQPAAGEPKKPRRGRSPKEDKAEPAGKEAAKPRKGRPPKADKAAPGEAQPSKRDKVSRSGRESPGRPNAPKGWENGSRKGGRRPGAGSARASHPSPPGGGRQAHVSETFRDASVPYIPAPSVQGAGRCQNAGNSGIH